MPWSRCCALTAAVGWTATNSLVAATRTEAGVSTLLRVPRQPLLEDSPASGCCGLRCLPPIRGIQRHAQEACGAQGRGTVCTGSQSSAWYEELGRATGTAGCDICSA